MDTATKYYTTVKIDELNLHSPIQLDLKSYVERRKLDM